MLNNSYVISQSMIHQEVEASIVFNVLDIVNSLFNFP